MTLVNAGGAQVEILSSYWLEGGTSADLVMATRNQLLPPLKDAETVSSAFSFCSNVGVRLEVIWVPWSWCGRCCRRVAKLGPSDSGHCDGRRKSKVLHDRRGRCDHCWYRI
jgi:hypothetical protein